MKKTKITLEIKENIKYEAALIEAWCFDFLENNKTKDLNDSCRLLAANILTYTIGALKNAENTEIQAVIKKERALLKEIK